MLHPIDPPPVVVVYAHYLFRYWAWIDTILSPGGHPQQPLEGLESGVCGSARYDEPVTCIIFIKVEQFGVAALPLAGLEIPP